ncbi:MAG: tellurite resistance/C4-dicarboxylate transporter family protein [Acidobacteria bacterium]|nr:tellurite resistance/C4-dicarboxylate transporter family protein [Acidobacteriota bacterium]
MNAGETDNDQRGVPPPRPAEALPSVADMHPASFSLVMATGIVSIGCELLDLSWLARALLWLNALFYAVLWARTLERVVRFPDRVWSDVAHHGRAVGFFTTVAATCVLGSQALVISQGWTVAAWLWLAGLVLWALLTYTIFTALTVKAEKPSLAQGINGGWLVAVVAAQSVAVLGAQLAPGFGARAADVLLLCLSLWLGGGMLYIWIISLIFYRYTFFTMSPADLAPPYWINMGAVAISTLAGTMLIAAAPHSALIRELLPFLKGFTLLFWATATWWIPMLVALGVWRHVYRRFPLKYDPLYWGAVFPLGMYTVCTFRLAQAVDAPVLMHIPRVFIYVALGAWTLAAAGLAREVARRTFRS